MREKPAVLSRWSRRLIALGLVVEAAFALLVAGVSSRRYEIMVGDAGCSDDELEFGSKPSAMVGSMVVAVNGLRLGLPWVLHACQGFPIWSPTKCLKGGIRSIHWS